MKYRSLACVSVLFFLLGWWSGMNQSSARRLLLPELQHVVSSDGNPVERTFDRDPCSSAGLRGHLAVTVRADFRGVTSDQGLFHLRSSTGNVTLELLPSQFHSLVLRIDSSDGSQSHLIGHHAWLGERELLILFGTDSRTVAIGEGVNARFSEVVLNQCSSIVVGGAPSEGDFQGVISVSLGSVPINFDVDRALEHSHPRLPAVLLQQFLIYSGLVGVLYAGYGWARSDSKKLEQQ
jgi:hypothetical protein